MAPPLRRKRCSFGGKEGVWWRRKASSMVVPTRPTPHSQPVMTTTNNDNEPVGLDKVSIRPPVPHPTFSRHHVSSSSSEDSGDDNPSTFAYEGERTQQRIQSLSTHLRKRRRKTFGGKSRRPLSLLLSNESNLFSSSTSREQEPSVAQRPTPDPEVNLDPRPGGQGATIPRPSLPRDKDRESLRVAPPNAIVSPFRFPNDDHEPLNRWDTPQRPTATSSIQQARDYFAYLDSAHQLQIDSSFSPSPRRHITRTTRKVQLSSPSFVHEYSKYARASRELGVTPLATREYAKSRRQFFRKAELFDGFVDS